MLVPFKQIILDQFISALILCTQLSWFRQTPHTGQA